MTPVSQMHRLPGINLTQKLLFVFLATFLFDCLAQTSFTCYIMYRQTHLTDNPFDPSIIHHLDKKLVLASFPAGVVGLVIALWAVRLLLSDKSFAKIVIVFLWVIATVVLIASYSYLARTEGRYLFHSMYFKLYLCGGIPLAISMLVGLIGMFRLFRTGK